MTADTLEGLNTVIQQLRNYPNKKSLHRQADDLKTIMSTAITYKETCMDDLTYNNDDDHDASKQSSTLKVMEGQDLGGKMCSNILAMIKNMTDTDIANIPDKVEHVGRRRLKEEVIWPKWLSVRDRKLLWFFGVTPNVTVAQNGKGNYTTIAAAVAAAPMKSKTRFVIKITAGVYKEYIEIPKHMNNIMFVGDGRPGNEKMTLIILFATLLFASVVHGTSSSSLSSSSSSAHSVIKSSCSVTLYPELCYSTLSTTTITPELTKKDVIELAVNKTKETV
nr:pectinesterase inhibitor domain, pectin lyase fold/virulence factor [Tanacetum cinerariifolium]